jgi:hypothetical protein
MSEAFEVLVWSVPVLVGGHGWQPPRRMTRGRESIERR